MFDYAINPAVEDMVVATGTGNAAPDKEGATDTLKLINTGVIRGFVSAFATRLAMRGVAKEEITETINTFINQCYHAGDLDQGSIRWLKDEDWYARAESAGSCCKPCEDPSSMWAYAYGISEDALCSRTYASAWGQEYRKSLPENERAILDNYEQAAKAYYEALRVRDEYFKAKSRACIKNLIVKYSDALSKLDQELYQFLCQRYEIASSAISADDQVTAL